MAATVSNCERGEGTRNKIAELVAAGASVNSCAKALGLSEPAVAKQWRVICANLGPQVS